MKIKKKNSNVKCVNYKFKWKFNILFIFYEWHKIHHKIIGGFGNDFVSCRKLNYSSTKEMIALP